jgi:hypothetical protein
MQVGQQCDGRDIGGLKHYVPFLPGEPTAVNRRVVKFQFVENPFSCLRFKGGIQSRGVMGVELVLHNGDALRIRVTHIDQVFQALLNPDMNFDWRAALRAALQSKFILQISNPVFHLLGIVLFGALLSDFDLSPTH